MKLVIASDIHGSAKYCRLLLEKFDEEQAEKLVLLGDILYHGPRNDLPEEYDPKAVSAMLAKYKDKILCVRGNCDAEVDQMVLPFPIMADYACIYADGVYMYLAHGHKDAPPISERDIYITGHTHVPMCAIEDYWHLNPGSVSLPKENSERGYILYEDKQFIYKTLDGEIYDKLVIGD